MTLAPIPVRCIIAGTTPTPDGHGRRFVLFIERFLKADVLAKVGT